MSETAETSVTTGQRDYRRIHMETLDVIAGALKVASEAVTEA